MSLDWNVKKVENFEEVLEDAGWPITEALVWYTIAIGMDKITESNATEFATRVSMWEEIHGGGVVKVNETTDSLYHHRITEADVRRRIGLYTNAGTLTKPQFNKKLSQILRYRAEARL